ncbi:MAG: hypothetical protein ACG0KC_01460 [Enterobacteriaceae bacterium]
MKGIFEVNLANKLNKKKICNYLLFGNSWFLIQENKNIIFKYLKKNKFKKKYSYCIYNNGNNWFEIIKIFYSLDVFEENTVLFLDLKFDFLNVKIKNNLMNILNLNNRNVIFIISYLNKSLSIIKEFILKTKKKLLIVNCSIPKKENIYIWIYKKFISMGLNIKKIYCKFIHFYYENNFEELLSFIKVFKTTFYKKINFMEIKKVIVYSAKFKILDWIKSIFYRKKNRSLRIINNINFKEKEFKFNMISIKKFILFFLLYKKKNFNLLNNSFFLTENNEKKIFFFLKRILIKFNYVYLRTILILIHKIIIMIIKKYNKKKILYIMKIVNCLFFNKNISPSIIENF